MKRMVLTVGLVSALAFIGLGTAVAAPGEDVLFDTKDGVKLSGRIFGDGKTGVVLAVGQERWWTFAEKLARNGYCALTFDLRGIRLSKGEPDSDKVDIDLEAAYDHLRTRVDRVALIGTGRYGAASVKLATRRETIGVAVISSNPTYGAQDIREDLAKLTVPKFFMACSAEEGQKVLMRLAAEPKRERVFPCADGTDLLLSGYGATVEDELLAFIKGLPR